MLRLELDKMETDGEEQSLLEETLHKSEVPAMQCVFMRHQTAVTSEILQYCNIQATLTQSMLFCSTTNMMTQLRQEE